jgi:hypothetical protein
VSRVLCDEDLPRQLRRDLPEFEVRTVQEAGWSGVKNGDLLRRAQEQFEVFVTADFNPVSTAAASGRTVRGLRYPARFFSRVSTSDIAEIADRRKELTASDERKTLATSESRTTAMAPSENREAKRLGRDFE